LRRPVVETVKKVIPGYTRQMKTAISINDETFRRAEERAAALGISRSEFFTRGAQLYLAQLESEVLTSRIDDVLARIGTDDEGAGAFGLRRLGELTEGDEW
jgi:hypothetical protein